MMQKEKYEYYNKLIDRFFDGYTTLEEEEELYSLFAGKELPEAWEKYRPLFGFFEKELKKGLEEINLLPENPRTGNTLKKWLAVAGVAATLLIAVFIGKLCLPGEKVRKPAGDYVVINGNKITDPEIIEAEEKAIFINYMKEEMILREILLLNGIEDNPEKWKKIEITIKE